MTTKELLKLEIDKLSEEQAEKAYKLVKEVKKETTTNGNKKEFKLNTVDLGGYFDDKDIRKLAYE